MVESKNCNEGEILAQEFLFDFFCYAKVGVDVRFCCDQNKLEVAFLRQNLPPVFFEIELSQ
jgi:hypothetical protein